MTAQRFRPRVDPVVLEIVHGAITAAEAEVEAAVERGSRSPMIRDQHDYRPGLHDRAARKLSGRSYSALVDAVIKRFGYDNIHEGDVFFMNDPYLSEAGIGHVPDLCSTVPVFHKGELIAFVQVFGHHDDVGGMMPGSLPTQATSIFQEGLLVPPIKLYDRGVLNEAAFEIVLRNSRLPDHLRADLQAEIAACQFGVQRIVDLCQRFGNETVLQAFDDLIDLCAHTVKTELMSKMRDGTYEFEDYIEHDGVTPARLHKLRMKMTKTADKIILDLNGTDPQARGPINWAVDYMDGKFLKKWVGVILRNLAENPRRAAEIDINEGICELIEIRFPEKGTLITPKFPAPVGMRFFCMLRLLGIFAGCVAQSVDGDFPADQETIRIWGLHGVTANDEFFLFREVLGGGSGGRPWADGSDVVHIVPNSRNLPVEFSETRFPVIVERLALNPDSGGPGLRRGGLGYLKEVRVLTNCTLLSNADRSVLACYGLKGGTAGQPYRVTIHPDSPRQQTLPGLVDNVQVRPGDLVRIATTGGGGWGDPLAREPERVALDVTRGLVSPESAERDYGVVLVSSSRWGEYTPDEEATQRKRRALRDARVETGLFDRGHGYKMLKQPVDLMLTD